MLFQMLEQIVFPRETTRASISCTTEDATLRWRLMRAYMTFQIKLQREDTRTAGHVANEPPFMFAIVVMAAVSSLAGSMKERITLLLKITLPCELLRA